MGARPSAGQGPRLHGERSNGWLGLGCCATLTADRCCEQSASSATPTLRRAGGEPEIAASEALGRELSDTGLHDHDRASSRQSCGLLLCELTSLSSRRLNMSIKFELSKG